MAKRFFYVCAGLLMLAIAYQLGVRAAGAQGGLELSVADIDPTYSTVGGIVDRTLVGGYFGNGFYEPVFVSSQPVPGTSPIVGVDSYVGRVVLANGDFYQWHSDPDGYWQLDASILDGLASAPNHPAPSRMNIRVSPNPSPSGFDVNFDASTSGPVDVELVDAQGRVAAHQQEVAARIGWQTVRFEPGPAVAPGIYFVRVTNGDASSTSKVVLVR